VTVSASLQVSREADGTPPSLAPPQLAASVRGPRFDRLLPAVVPALVVIAWQLATASGVLSSRVLPRPGDVAAAAWRLMRTGELLRHIGISSLRAFGGFFIGGGIGFALGVVNGYSRLADRLFDTPLQMVRNVPHLALIPMVIIWFGLGEEAKVFLVALGVFFPVYVNTLHGVRSVDPALIEMARVFHLSRWELFRKVIFPGAIPSVLVGVRFGLGVMWLTLIVAETIGADSGIGYLAMSAREFMQTDVVVACVILYALLGKWADSTARWLERWFLAWHPSQARASGRAPR
jgi:sulfonate transport system permease protein